MDNQPSLLVIHSPPSFDFIGIKRIYRLFDAQFKNSDLINLFLTTYGIYRQCILQTNRPLFPFRWEHSTSMITTSKGGLFHGSQLLAA